MAASDWFLPAPPLPGVVPARARTVFVVTHPEATHHVDGLVGGQFDSELTAKGLEDAERIAAALAGWIGEERSRSVVSSDLRRTAQTATVIGDVLGVEPDLDRRLREKSYGVAGGREQSWLDERFVSPPAVGDRLRHHEGIDGAETRLEVASRVYAAMSDALARDGGGAGAWAVRGGQLEHDDGRARARRPGPAAGRRAGGRGRTERRRRARRGRASRPAPGPAGRRDGGGAGAWADRTRPGPRSRGAAAAPPPQREPADSIQCVRDQGGGIVVQLEAEGRRDVDQDMRGEHRVHNAAQ
ncbi:histidine phosphatase family protein [Isoptericola sp. G70]|uniref:histidine phosphatase family protein n=1 Tax=Isoptericola sp. G70 TaxID=3376633 RepID=UPI003A800205